MAQFNYQILTADEQLCVVVENGATEYRPYIFKNGNIYDPENEFRPVGAKPKTKSLPQDQRDRAAVLLADAKNYWTAPVVATPAAPAVPETPVVPTTPQTTLDTLIAKSVAELSVNSVMGAAKPFIEKYITETYGLLPKTLRVETPTVTSEVKGLTHNKFETILKLVLANIPVFLTGPAGCGKNVICQQVAEALNTEFYFTNAVTQEYKLTGFIDANGHYHETQFFKAFTQGGVFMLDEMDASVPEVLIILNAAIANGYFDFPNGKFQAHKDFHLVAAEHLRHWCRHRVHGPLPVGRRLTGPLRHRGGHIRPRHRARYRRGRQEHRDLRPRVPQGSCHRQHQVHGIIPRHRPPRQTERDVRRSGSYPVGYPPRNGERRC